MKIDKFKDVTALRCWAIEKDLPKAAAELLQEALKQGITPSVIVFSGPESEDKDYEIILWGDS